MKLKKGVINMLNILLVYAVAGVLIFAMSKRVEMLNEQDRLEKEYSVAIKISK